MKKLNQNGFTTIMLVLLITAIMLIVGLAAWNVYQRSEKNANGSYTLPVTDPKKEYEEKLKLQLESFVNPKTGEVWLDKPVEIAKQGYVPASYEGGDTDKYYNVGKRGDNTIIMTSSESEYGGSFWGELFEQLPNGKVMSIRNPSASKDYEEAEDKTMYFIHHNPNIQFNADIHYDSLTIPDRIKIDDEGRMVIKPPYTRANKSSYNSAFPPDGPSDYASKGYKAIKKLGKSTLFIRETTNIDTKLVSINYFIKYPINSTEAMDYEPIDLNLKNYQWQNGNSIDDTMRAVTYGCGNSGSGASVTRSDALKDSDTKLAGKSSNGLSVYEFVDKNNVLLQKAYGEFKDYYSYSTAEKDKYYKNMSLDEFIKQHGVVLYKDLNGEWLVYTRDDLRPQGGCAKPVIYLYPTKEQTVKVRIGANVKISDPYYNPNTGWTVSAKPNGQLDVNGNKYNSLFWEGPGMGEYPGITAGTVVKKQDAIKTIRQQLVMQGLNSNETQDFIDYWQNKLPNKPYIRLTWFNTAQMNNLAPLKISPKPDTTIRVFLDAGGLDQPIDIPSQNLKPIIRLGFTVVEWGGLSNQKLY